MEAQLEDASRALKDANHKAKQWGHKLEQLRENLQKAAEESAIIRSATVLQAELFLLLTW